MKLNFTINGNEIELNVHPELRLLQLLRQECKISGVKRGCGEGRCGLCLILLNEKPVYSCQIPAFHIQGKEIKTIEGIVNSELFQMIYLGLKKAEIFLCDYCAPSRVLSLYALFEARDNPNQQEIEDCLQSVKCSCSSNSAFFYGIRYIKEEVFKKNG